MYSTILMITVNRALAKAGYKSWQVIDIRVSIEKYCIDLNKKEVNNYVKSQTDSVMEAHR